MDGERLVSDDPAAGSFSVERDGRYELWETVAGEDRDDWPTAVYEWVAGSDVVTRLHARLGAADETMSGFRPQPGLRRTRDR